MTTELVQPPPIDTSASTLPHLRIEASQGWVSLKLRELWEYRELLYFLVWRDITARRKLTLSPFVLMVD